MPFSFFWVFRYSRAVIMGLCVDMAETLGDVDRARAVQMAWSLWDMFIQKHAKMYDNSSLFKKDVTRNPYRNPCAEAFMYFCAKAGPCAEGGIITRQTLTQVRPNKPNRAVSWLSAYLNRAEHKCPILVIDSDYLKDQIPVLEAPLVVHRVYTRLLLHEVGHLVLHWDQMIQELTSKDAPASLGGLEARWPVSSPKQEAEAWLFCYAVLGAGIGRYAFLAREGPVDDNDPAWRILAQLSTVPNPPL